MSPSAPAKPAAPTTVLRLLFFGPIRTQLALDDLDLPAANEISPADLWSQLLALHPVLAPLRPTTRLARDGDFLRDEDTLRPGEEIALIPPVSGG